MPRLPAGFLIALWDIRSAPYCGKRWAPGQTLLAGIELVEIPGISELTSPQIRADLMALKEAGADGLSISWDLWHIPDKRLEIVRDIWG